MLRRAITDPEMGPGEARALAFEMDRVLGLQFSYADKLLKIPFHVRALVRGREVLRHNQQFVKADSLRNKVQSLGYEIEDTSYGPFIWPNKKQKSLLKI
ncbi:MAG: hypothetical protein A2Y84_00385 [Candidatus Colwellbacteria bacterium RBG_13_48_8]|uniref:Uncharacterized protein n=1 Tax=Candidatus Colwellbacteria bacterium RBG_13_48_8 TaxID=1797685 RepID=A0A1G1YV37_9BACT|nr:MAG: hypothetical protein A2Y84_00385 [Candidatus Colwellbacteria bacterium RBG_13_48_8]